MVDFRIHVAKIIRVIIEFCFRVTINMPPKRRHRNDSENSNGAVKRIRIKDCCRRKPE